MIARLDQLFASQDMRSHPLAAMHVVMATRLAFLYSRAGRDPIPDLAVRLRSMRAAQAHASLMATIGEVWPETFMVRRPCCMALGPDEMLLADLASAALRGDRAAATQAMRDMLPAPARERLFRDMVELVDAIRSVPVGETRNAG